MLILYGKLTCDGVSTIPIADEEHIQVGPMEKWKWLLSCWCSLWGFKIFSSCCLLISHWPSMVSQIPEIIATMS